jgi:hypothetical protein
VRLLTTTTIVLADATRAAAAEETEIGDHETATEIVSGIELETMTVIARGETAGIVTVETETELMTVAVEKEDAVAEIKDGRPRHRN